MIFNHSQVSHRLVIPLLMALFYTSLGRAPVSAQEQSSRTPDMQQM